MADPCEFESKKIDPAQSRPPRLAEILDLSEPLEDELYDFFGLLFGGVKGAWHRLWACLVSHWATDEGSFLNFGDLVLELRLEVEEFIGRPMNEKEWAALNDHAKAHAEKVMKPIVASYMHPPALEDIVDLENNPLGSFFELNQELRAQFDGAWKRLWGCIVMHSASEEFFRCSIAYMQDCRMEVEELFERDISGEEWTRLIEHAELCAQKKS